MGFISCHGMLKVMRIKDSWSELGNMIFIMAVAIGI